jgi:hypothetical protein
MTTTGLRQISLLVNQPVRAQLTEPASPGAQLQAEISMGRATREYIDTLQLYFKELDEYVQDPRRKNANVYGRWFNKYADRIDMLSLARTDPEIFKLSSSVSAGLRENSQPTIARSGNFECRSVRRRMGVRLSANRTDASLSPAGN